MRDDDTKARLRNASEAIIRILASCDWGNPSHEYMRGDSPRLHLQEALFSLDFLTKRVQAGDARPMASDVLVLAIRYYLTQCEGEASKALRDLCAEVVG